MPTAKAVFRILPLDSAFTLRNEQAYNDPAIIEDNKGLKQSFLERGQATPIRVIDDGQGGFIVINGSRRVICLKELWQAGQWPSGTIEAYVHPTGSDYKEYFIDD